MKTKIFFIFLCFLVSSTYAQVDSDAVKHNKDAVREALIGVGFLSTNMVSLPIEEYICDKYNVPKEKQETIKVITGVILGSITLYYAARADHDMSWFQLKLNRVIHF